MGVYGCIDMIVLYSHAFLVRRYELKQQAYTHEALSWRARAVERPPLLSRESPFERRGIKGWDVSLGVSIAAECGGAHHLSNRSNDGRELVINLHACNA